ncbi:MAG: ABC transporter ATP-binding protein, partial [Chloroflexus sp.]|nr:ABC transporter ATP-binding protein [Chloroflexus sp.]
MVHHANDDTILGKAYDGRLVRRLAKYVMPYWRQFSVAILLLIGAILSDLLPPLLLQRAIDGPIQAGAVDGVWPYFVAFVGTLLINFVFRYSHSYFINSVGQQVMKDLRVAIFRHVQYLSLSFFNRNPVGRLITRITNDVDALNEFLTQGVVMIVADLLTLVGIIVVMFVLNWRLALISLATLPVLVLIVSIYQRFMRATYRLVRQRLARINAFLSEQISGILVTQLFNAEERSRMAFARLSDDYMQAN